MVMSRQRHRLLLANMRRVCRVSPCVAGCCSQGDARERARKRSKLERRKATAAAGSASVAQVLGPLYFVSFWEILALSHLSSAPRGSGFVSLAPGRTPRRPHTAATPRRHTALPPRWARARGRRGNGKTLSRIHRPLTHTVERDSSLLAPHLPTAPAPAWWCPAASVSRFQTIASARASSARARRRCRAWRRPSSRTAAP